MTAPAEHDEIPDVGTVDDEEPVVLDEVPTPPDYFKAVRRHMLGSALPARLRKGAK